MRSLVIASKSTVHFKNASDGHDVELEVRGDWFDRSANITFGGQPVAHISRSFFNVREIFAAKDTVCLFVLILVSQYRLLKKDV